MHQVHSRPDGLTTADLVTGSRFVLAAVLAIAAIAGGPQWLVGTLAGTALLTDLVDGRLARATSTVTRLGARLDQEADAVLILVLSAIVAADLGPWVLGIGLARYAFGALFRVVPGLRTPPVRARGWCRVVAAGTGIVLAVVATLDLPRLLGVGAVALVAVLLLESFVHEGLDRWRSPADPVRVPYPSLAALLVVWAALTVPAHRDDLSAAPLLRLPVEVLGLVLLALVPVRRLRQALAVAAGLVLAALLLVRILDLSFHAVFDREFDPVGDWSYLGPGVGVLGDSIGVGQARAVAVLAGVAVVLLLVLVPVCVLRLVAVIRRQRRRARPAAAGFATAWVLCAALGLPVVSAGAAGLTVTEVRLIHADVQDHQAFARQIAADRYRTVPPGLLAGLAGKDVLLVFVESYGRVAVQGTPYSVGVDRVLDQGTRQLDHAGYSIRSAFLTSPTFGAGSWLAHSTLQSGLWVDSQRRYRQLLGARRQTLTRMFAGAGWHTVFDVPADTEDWPEGKDFYGFDQYYDSRNVGYAGPKFGYAPIPDQYTLAQFRRAQLKPGRRQPVMAELDLVSSHHPWTPLPSLVPWDRVGDGSAYTAMSQQPSSAELFRSAAAVKQKYGESLQYTWRALTSFLTTYPDPDRVVVVLGDHQPHSYVSGKHVGHDVPVSVIAQDPAVVQRIAGWGWQRGLRPSPDAQVWRMDSFRDRFLAAFSR